MQQNLMFWAVIAHVIGDYWLQSDWMAMEKTKRSLACLVHVLLYTVPFLVLTRSVLALALICVSHFVIDRWRLARHVSWVKNYLQPKTTVSIKKCLVCGLETLDQSTGPCPECGPMGLCNWQFGHYRLRNVPWRLCQDTGYPSTKPSFMAVWLMIIVDQSMHLTCNAVALLCF